MVITCVASKVLSVRGRGDKDNLGTRVFWYGIIHLEVGTGSDATYDYNQSTIKIKRMFVVSKSYICGCVCVGGGGGVVCSGLNRQIRGKSWDFVPLGYCPLGYCPPWVFVHIDLLGRAPWAFVPIGFCPPGFLSSLDFVRLEPIYVDLSAQNQPRRHPPPPPPHTHTHPHICDADILDSQVRMTPEGQPVARRS